MPLFLISSVLCSALHELFKTSNLFKISFPQVFSRYIEFANFDHQCRCSTDMVWG